MFLLRQVPRHMTVFCSKRDPALFNRSLPNPEQEKWMKFTNQNGLFGISECGKCPEKE
jgi:hypothetical protein